MDKNEMKEKIGVALSIKYGLIVLLFFLPFIKVSCTSMTITGMNFATGTTMTLKSPFDGKVHKQKVNKEPFATIALGAAVLGLIMGFRKTKSSRIISAVAGGAGVISLIFLKNKIDKDVMREGGGMIVVNYEIGFWLVMLLFITAAVVSIYGASILSKPKIE